MELQRAYLSQMTFAIDQNVLSVDGTISNVPTIWLPIRRAVLNWALFFEFGAVSPDEAFFVTASAD